MKKYLITNGIISVLLVVASCFVGQTQAPEIAMGAATSSYYRTMYPVSSTPPQYDVGTSTHAWASMTAGQFCLSSGECATSTFGTGGSSIAVSSSYANINGLTAGSVTFASSSGQLWQDNSNFFWDDANNRLGIGTTSPAYKLDIYSTGATMLRIQRSATDVGQLSASNNDLNLISNTNNLVLETASGKYISFKDGAVENMRITGDGKIGIGTTTPPSNLTVAGDIHLTGDIWGGNSNYTEGMQSDPVIADADGVAVSVTSADVLIRSNSTYDGDGRLYRKTIAASTSLQMTDDSINYIIVNWNLGTPRYEATTTRDVIDVSDIVPVARVYMSGGNIEYQMDYDYIARGATARNFERVMRIRGSYGIEKESGLSISESATRIINLTSGYAWFGLSRKTLEAIVQNSTNTEIYYHTGGVWTSEVTSTYNNYNYDNGTDIAVLTANRYTVNWIYRNVTTNQIDIVLGTGDYTLAQAEASTIPTPPLEVANFYVLTGRIIVQKGSDTAYSIETVQDVSFNQTIVSAHSDLTNLSFALSGHTGFAGLAVQNTFTTSNTFANQVGIGTTTFSDLFSVAGNINTTGTYKINGADVGQYFITTAGTNGQVWMSDGTGAGGWVATSTLYGTLGSMAYKTDTDYLANAFMAAKGDLITATANDTPVILSVGANGTYLGASSTAASGLAWFTTSSLSIVQNELDPVFDALASAKGDIYTATANDTPAVLTVGANGKLLMASSTATTGLEWVATSTLGVTASAAGADYQIQYNASNTLAALDFGNANQVLLSNGTGQLPTWVSTSTLYGTLGTMAYETANNYIAKAFMAAKGDLITATANDTPSILSIGTDGWVLMASSTAANGIAWTPTSSLGIVGGSTYPTALAVTGTLKIKPDATAFLAVASSTIRIASLSPTTTSNVLFAHKLSKTIILKEIDCSIIVPAMATSGIIFTLYHSDNQDGSVASTTIGTYNCANQLTGVKTAIGSIGVPFGKYILAYPSSASGIVITQLNILLNGTYPVN